ncbi:hypothetical protein JOC77_003247 [Peribacillus deserti]|uniref:Uncharacterized protein n=1 Tax=Peribacillus deserti TaxID=673318 RepID=A0ABS2QMW1_9BACI|nr:hypothetical protein [Peribacillus deserti]MBM7693803.1 hypothetical protein [Peribacillus deserti]
MLFILLTMLYKDFDILGIPLSALLNILTFALGIAGLLARALGFWRKDNEIMAFLCILAALSIIAPLYLLYENHDPMTNLHKSLI